MDDTLALVCLGLTLLCAVLGLASLCCAGLRGKSGSRGRAFAVWMGLAAVCLVGTVLAVPEGYGKKPVNGDVAAPQVASAAPAPQATAQAAPEATAQAAREAAPAPLASPVAQREAKALPFAMRDIVREYNASAPGLGLPAMEQAPFSSKEGVRDVYQHHLNKYAIITFMCAHKQQVLTGVMVNAAGDGSQQSGAVMLLTLANVFAAMTPGMPANDRGRALGELGITNGRMADGRQRKVAVGGVTYSTMFNQQMGLMLGADPE